MRIKFGKLFLAAGVSLFAASIALTPVTAVAQSAACKDSTGPSKTLDASTAKVLQVVFQQMQDEQYQEALAGLNNLINTRGDRMKPFDKATTHELRGSVKASLEDYRGAARDFKAALATNALSVKRNNQLRYFIAQLSFQEEDYASAISGLNEWIRQAQQCGTPVDTNAYYLLAAAYIQITPPNPRAAVGPAEKAVAGSPEPRKSYYDLLNRIYSDLGDNAKRAPLLERMVNHWPGTKGYWTQLSGAYSTMGKDRDAFSVLEVAYRAGLLTTESEMLTLIQYYSFFENPYRGAVMLEREMNAGNIKRTQKNLILLSQLWSQSREHKKAIPILQEAAKGSSNGTLYYRLGQVLLADEKYQRAERALTSAVNKGGMKSKDTGDAWLLLGTAQFNQAGPTDTEIWAKARKSFKNAQRYEGARKRATDWIVYIDAVAKTYRDGIELEKAQLLARCEDDQQRMETQERIRELQNRPITNEERAIEAEFLQRCSGPLGLNETGDVPATDDAEETPAEDADTGNE